MIDAAEPPRPAAGLFRRLAALLYDGLLLLALWMIATALFLPFTGGEAVLWQTHPVLRVIHLATLAAILVGFYGLFWTRQGHTLGMASWRLRLERSDGARLTWADTVRRIAGGLLSWLPAGLGWWWCLFDAQGRTWHYMLSATRVYVEPKGLREPRP
ncbi:MAG: RDD family protein [Steroidobacteraceae bacterium]